MSIICQECKQPIASKKDLIVVLQWWFIPRPLHNTCWGQLWTAHKGVGSISYQTGVYQAGVLQGKNRKYIINTPMFTIFSLIIFLIGVYVLLFANFSSTIVSNGRTFLVTPIQTLISKLVIFVLCSLPLVLRMWSYIMIEKKINE